MQQDFRPALDKLDIRDYTGFRNSNIEIEGDQVPRSKFQTLTEQMFYVLLSLNTERSGVEILEAVSAMTAGRVSVGSGTLYTLLEQFVYAGFICETRVEGRRRSYVLTELGRETLKNEYGRITAQAEDYLSLIHI